MRIIQAVLALLFLTMLTACGKPLPADKATYAGHWSGAQVELVITPEGRVDYKRSTANGNTSIKSPIKEFAGNDMVVGVGPMATTFVVSAPPHREGDAWKMTVDGVELTRN